MISFVCPVRMQAKEFNCGWFPKAAGGRSPFHGQDASCTRLTPRLPETGHALYRERTPRIVR